MINRINPLDLEPNIAIGVKLPFNNSAVFNSTYKTEEQIKYNLINYLLTNSGERILNPEFGSNLRNFLFEMNVEDNIDDIRSSITDGIKKNIPEIGSVNINIYPQIDENLIQIELNYTIRITGNQDTIVLNFN